MRVPFWLLFDLLFFLFSFSLIFFTLLVILFASASEINRLGFTEFLLQQGGRGGMYRKGEGRGLVNMDEINN